MKTIVIAGATGVVGSAAVDYFLNEKEWTVFAISRRKLQKHPRLRHIEIDLQDKSCCLKALSNIKATHLVYAALYELPGLTGGYENKMHMQINLQMLQNLLSPLLENGLKHISLLQGTKAYGIHLHPIPIPAREDAARDPHENFYWLQEDYVREMVKNYDFSFTIMRPPLVVGGSYGVSMNIIPIIGIYATICKEEGRPLSFPGEKPLLLQTIDSRLLAKAFAWATESKLAKNEIFNLSNGDETEWHTLWPIIAEVFKMPVGENLPCELKNYLPSKTTVWAEIIKKYGLKNIDMHQLLGESHHYADIIFGYGLKQSIPPALLSTIKIRQAGFHDCLDSRLTYSYWLKYLMEQKIIPRY